MADIEYNTNAAFYFDCDGMELVIEKCTIPPIEMKVAAGSGAIGCGRGGITQTHATPGAVEYGSGLKLEYVAGSEAEQKKISTWYKNCHPTSFSGGGTKSRKNRKTASLFIYDMNDNIGAQYDFIDCFPSSLTQTSQLDVGKPGELAKDTMEIRFTKMVRVDV